MTKEDHSQKSGNNVPLDLSALTDFQFGPAWARGGASGATFLHAKCLPARRLVNAVFPANPPMVENAVLNAAPSTVITVAATSGLPGTP